MRSQRVLMSSSKKNWGTPDLVLDLLRKVAQINFDGASDARNLVGCPIYVSRRHVYLRGQARGPGNGFNVSAIALMRRFRLRGMGYWNPPYGERSSEWAKHIASEAEALQVGCRSAAALVGARTDAVWFDPLWESADRCLFWASKTHNRRLKFKGAGVKNSATFPNALFFWGATAGHTRAFDEVFGAHGRLVELRNGRGARRMALVRGHRLEGRVAA